jgi:hypothetical protein
VELKPVIKGVASYVPGLYSWRSRRMHLRTANAEYCYSVWLRHLLLLSQTEGFTIPKTVAELGPGGSLGVGLAALLSGADTYYALDIVKYSKIESNLDLLDGLVELFGNRTPVSTGYAGDSLQPPVFPHHILTDELLAETLAESRLADIRRAIAAPDGRSGPITIEYTVPWSDPAVIRRHEVDLIVSYSVLEHVDDLPGTYDAFAQWLRPGGRMSHSVDFRSHFDTKAWNSHWQYSEPVWKLIVGKKPFLINRQPYSVHIAEMKERGFEIIREWQKRELGLPREALAARWRNVSEDDYTCIEAIIQARLPES